MYTKKMKLFKRIMSVVSVLAMVISSLTVNTDTVSAADGRLIDVWDFGCVAETDTTLHNNLVTTDGWEANTNLGSAQTGYFAAGGTQAFGDLKVVYNSSDRVYGSASNAISSLSSWAKIAFSDGYTAAGGYYCGGTAGASKRYLTLDNVVKGDKVVVYMSSSNSSTDNVHFLYTGSDGSQDESGAFSNTGAKYEFVAEYSGSYKIYCTSDGGAKPVYLRVERVPGVSVTGTIDFGTYSGSDYTVKFVNDTNSKEVEATVTDGSYSAVLAPGYTYTAVFSGATGFGFTSASKKVTVAESQILTGTTANLVVEEKTVYDYTGSVTGFAADYDLSNLEVKLVPPADTTYDTVKLSIASDMSFTASLEPDVEYTVELVGANDYKITSSSTICDNQDLEADITVTLKSKYTATGEFVGLPDDATVTSLTFTNVDDEYTYSATVSGNSYSVKLRDGAYQATAVVDNYRTISHVVVDGAASDKDLYFAYTGVVAAKELKSDIYVGYTNTENNYATIQEAVDAAAAMAPESEEQRITIHIAPGTYREQVVVNTPYITFINDDATEDVKITWYYGIGYKYYSAAGSEGILKGFYSDEYAFDKYEKNIAEKWGTTVFVNKTATAFRAENIIFEASFNRYLTDEEIEDGVELAGSSENTSTVRKYGVDVTSKAATERATALYSYADKAEYYNCTMLSSQDTLYTGTGVHNYFKNCFIQGNTDFIFGDGDAVFDNCELSIYGYSTGATNAYITAARTPVQYGYLFRNCTVTANDELEVVPAYWGRPWGATSTVTLVNTKLETEDLITDAGWSAMGTVEAAAANYVEYNTTSLDGKTVDTTMRTSGTVTTTAPTVAVTEYFGTWTPSYYVEEAETVEFTTAPYVVDNGDINAPYPGHTLTVGYSLGTANDANDASIINWYRVNGTEETLVKTSTAVVDKKYTITSEDIGAIIKVTVTPVTTSGNAGTAASFSLEETVRDGFEDPTGSTDIVLGDGINVFLAGDSTVKDYSANGMYMKGSAQNEGAWGEFLQSFFDSDKVTIQNYANGGRSTRNYINEGTLDKIAENISEGDYLFIQFGHNDCSVANMEDRYVPLGTPDDNGVYPTTAGTKVETPSSLVEKYGSTWYSYDCGGTFKWYLQQYIDVATSKGATPVLVTPVSRMYYDTDGTIYAHHDADGITENNAYVTAIKQLAEEQNVLLIDGFEITKTMFESAYAADSSASGKTSTYGSQVMATGDKTHCNKLGGFIEAAYIAQAIQAMNKDISTAVQMPAQVLGETTDGATVFSVTGKSVLTAYDITTDYASEATYWTSEGQKIINAIGEAAGEVVPDTDDSGESGGSEDSGESGGTTVVEPTATMWVVGDSTVCEFDDNYYYPRYGYGTQLYNYFDGTYEVKNLALSGRSSLSFLSEPNYKTLINGMAEGDVLVIGFGHNDEKAEADRYTNPNGDYTTAGSFAYTLYENYIKPAKAAGVEVILCTPIVRRTTGTSFSNSQVHITSTTTVDGVTYEGGDYPQAIKDLGTAVNVPVIDLTTLTKELYLSLGASETLYLHAWQSSNSNSVDNTHINIYGAKQVAYMFANALKSTDTVAATHVLLGTEPTKDNSLVVNPGYVEVEYDNSLSQSTLWEDYGVFKGTVFGNLGGESKINTTNFNLGTDENGNMRVAALSGNGKIAASADGLAMYYYKVPASSQFTISATAYINSITTTSEVAFGLMARDDMYIDTNNAAILSDYVVAGTLGTGTNCFRRKDTVLTKGSDLSTGELAAGQEYKLEIVSHTDGYACTFGNETTQTGGYDYKLTSIDSDYVYIGMFASRKADISFKDITITVDGNVVYTTVESGGSSNDTSDDTYVGNVNSELLKFTYDEVTKYISGEIVVVEWVDGVSTVPSVKPVMTFDSTDGTESIEVFVTATGTNTYYFDRLLDAGLTEGKDYVFTITSGNPLNVSEYRSVPIYTGTSSIGSEGKLGTVGLQRIMYKTDSSTGYLLVYGEPDIYEGQVNSVLTGVTCVKSESGANFVSGNIVIVEWIDGVSNVPSTTPEMTFESYDGTEVLPVYMASIDGTNTYYFDRNLNEDMDVTKEYIFRITLTDPRNVSSLKTMIATTNYMDAKEGMLWETDTQYVMYKTVAADGDNQLRVYAVNK